MTILRRDLLVAFFAITIFLCVIPIITYVYFAATLADKDNLVRHNDVGIRLLDVKNRPFFTFYEARFEKAVPLSSIPKIIQQAVIAMEDKDFYSHPGFSIPAIFRSVYADFKSESLSYGASTITQQLVKNSLLYSGKNFLRKYQEIILAQEVERRYSKDEILEMYLNSVYFGEGAYGIEEAARVYFNKSAQNLNLAQSAALAGILPAPSQLSWLSGDLREAKLRQRIVLEKMAAENFITKQQKEAALQEDLKITPFQGDINKVAPHFALMVRDELVQRYGEAALAYSGWQVKTTLDLDWQRIAQQVLKEQLGNLHSHNVSNGAVVVLEPKTSEIKALVGSYDWNNNSFGKVNMAISPRPPGSAFKPIVYVKAFEDNLITPATQLADTPTSFANFDENKFYASFPTRFAALLALQRDPDAFYKPLNFDRKFRGAVTVRRALANSLNVPAVAVMKKVGVEKALNSAKNLGITTLGDPSNYGLSLVLGTGEVKLLELTNAYAVFANNGLRNNLTSILEITDRKGQFIYEYQPEPVSVIDGKYAFLISSILSDNKIRAEQFGTALNISRPAAVKTGTTEDFKDAWTIGYTPSLVVGVWLGNNFNQPMDGIAGSLGAAPIWRQLIETFLEGTAVEQFTPPEGIVRAVCGFNVPPRKATREGILKETSSSAEEYFVKGTEPAGCRSIPISSSSPSPTAKP